MKILYVMDPLERIEVAGDTTYAFMLECAERNHEIWTCEVGDLAMDHHKVTAEARLTRVVEADSAERAFAPEPRTLRNLGDFDVVFMRKDPPVNEEFLQATWLLEAAREQTLVVNDPRGLRELNEHLSILRFPDLIPPTLVTRSQERLRKFLAEQGGKIVVKPVEGYGGRGIFVISHGDPNTSSLLETATNHGSAWTMAQKYLPEAIRGDKRIMLVQGELLGAVLRVPKVDEARGNLHVGGSPHKTEITEREHQIIERLRPVLAHYGVFFAGIDVIGDKLTEINVTSPTGIRHLDGLHGGRSATRVIERLEELAKKNK